MIKSFLLTLLLFPTFVSAQNLPLEVQITNDGHLKRGSNKTTGFYNTDVIHKIEFTLTESNWFTLLDGSGGGGPGGGGGGTPGVSLIGKLTFNDTLVLDSVLISIKGNTSDTRNPTQKKSFKVEIDELKDQELMGYDNLNLNCAYEDESFMREVVYGDITRNFAPALKGNFVELHINGTYWGLYNNIQQLEGTYIKEWFLNNDGTRWRAINEDGNAPTGGGGGPGGPGGGGGGTAYAGFSSLNYHGANVSDYDEYYTLKASDKDNPWEDLITACDKLNNLPTSDLYTELDNYIDVDRTLWYIAQEVAFSDDDSYIHKGGMDYYVYWDDATERIIPMEVDGNSVLGDRNLTTTYPVFLGENDVKLPIMNKLLQNDEVRQRYLAHLRTVLKNDFVKSKVDAKIDEFAALIDQKVKDESATIRLYDYNTFKSGVTNLKNNVGTRINYLSMDNEVNRTGIALSNITNVSNGTQPEQNEKVQINVTLDEAAKTVYLYYGEGLDGKFERVEMKDDGSNNDGSANDLNYGGEIPGYVSATYVRYYVEAIKNDANATASYIPEGAEHDVYIYQVKQAVEESDALVINEFMASNESSVKDSRDEYEDWVELYNNSDEEIDLTGYYLSDDATNATKWEFPANTKIGAKSYLIVWTDDDGTQTTTDEIHSNFKLSASGESVVLSNKDFTIINQVDFTQQETDRSFARSPNGTGDFVIKSHTFNANNDGVASVITVSDKEISIYPNPATEMVFIDFDITFMDENISIYNIQGSQVFSDKLSRDMQINVSDWANGIYLIRIRDFHSKLIIE